MAVQKSEQMSSKPYKGLHTIGVKPRAGERLLGSESGNAIGRKAPSGRSIDGSIHRWTVTRLHQNQVAWLLGGHCGSTKISARKSMQTLETATLSAIKNVLYPTDFSAAAESALPFVYDLARLFGCRVTAVHVRTPEADALTPPLAFPYQTELSQDRLHDIVGSLDDRLGAMQHENIVGEGEVWDFIARVLRERDIDLIIIGTHGRTGFEKLLLGSVAESIFRQADCPVLTIGPHVVHPGIGRWELKNILMATDFTTESKAAEQAAFWLAEKCAARLALLHVLETPEGEDLLDPHRYITSTARVLEHEVPKGAHHNCQVNYVINDGVPGEQIVRVARERNCDLIVLGVRSAVRNVTAATHLSRPTAHKVVSRASCPVLTVRA